MNLQEHARPSPTNWTVSTLDYERLLPLVAAPQLPVARHELDELDQKLASATTVAPTRIEGNVVTMNSKVLLRCASWERPREYRLVYALHGACDPGEVSVVSPLGAGLLGTRVGARFAVGSHTSARSFEVLALTYQPESAGDWDL
jgi:regulator of nucleoside diphosphate kinase